MKFFSVISALLLFAIFTFFIHKVTYAQGEPGCDNRYVTLVNPVRGRELWMQKGTKPFDDQYALVKQYGVPATWLLQYDVFSDQQLMSNIDNFGTDQEKGVFLEVSEKFAKEARVIYPWDSAWFSPRAVFLSGYSQSERRKLIDTLFTEFKLKFGYYPKSAGAWWIDSYSLNYMREKYGIKSVMIVADQKTTDSYGVWGQWWGVPYYPAKANILTPASNKDNKLDVVVIQWAQRDPKLAIGEGWAYSNYSLQANDYIRQKKDTIYFNQIANAYLDCQNPIGQITVGLETGIESVGYLGEYKNQLESLRNNKKLNFVTMSQFAEKFKEVFPDFPKKMVVSYQDLKWDLTPAERTNSVLGEKINYQQDIAFADYFVADKSNFLNRKLTGESRQKDVSWFPLFLIAGGGLLIFAHRKKLIRVWIISMLFAVGAFGLSLRSYYNLGWKVYFGPEVPYLEIFQILFVLASFFVVWLFYKKNIIKKDLWLLPLIFGLDYLVQLIRVSHFSNKLYIGMGVDALRFVGLSIKSASDIALINQDFPSVVSAAFLRFNFNRVWDNQIAALLVYPLAHIALAVILGLVVVKLPKRLRKAVIVFLAILFLLQVNSIFMADPRKALLILLQY